MFWIIVRNYYFQSILVKPWLLFCKYFLICLLCSFKSKSRCVDESMVGFKGRHQLKQYISNKKARRWGIKLWVLSDSITGYTHHINVYKGRRNERHSPNGQVCCYLICAFVKHFGFILFQYNAQVFVANFNPRNDMKRTLLMVIRNFPQGYQAVMDLMEPRFYKDHHVTYDSFFTSPALVYELLDKGTHSIGTVIKTRKGMPSSFKTTPIQKGEIRVKITDYNRFTTVRIQI